MEGKAKFIKKRVKFLIRFENLSSKELLMTSNLTVKKRG
jgi:hypothetical protein